MAQLRVSAEVQLSIGEVGGVLFEPRLDLVQRRLKVARVDDGEQVALGNVLALLRQGLLQLAVDTGADGDLLNGSAVPTCPAAGF